MLRMSVRSERRARSASPDRVVATAFTTRQLRVVRDGGGAKYSSGAGGGKKLEHLRVPALIPERVVTSQKEWKWK